MVSTTIMQQKKLWRLKSKNSTLNIILANQLNISEALAQILINRGIHTVDEANGFLESKLNQLHDPFLLRDMEQAVLAVSACLKNGKPILIYGDYDVDGISATALLVNALHRLGGVVDYYIPRREQGYGLHKEVLNWAADEGHHLVITVDCGIAAVEEAKLAQELGIELIITDHHEPKSTMPEAVAVINPKRPDCTYPFKDLAGVGVALKLVQAIYHNLGLPKHAWYDLLDVACLGTVADIVPLLGENRIIVKHGLRRLQTSPNLGLAALKEVSGVTKTKITPRDVGFALGPRLNAAGRIGDPRLGVELLLCPKPEWALEIAQQLDASNRERRDIEQEVLEEAIALLEARPESLENKVLVLASDNWHPGVIGIVASRLLDRYHRPVLMISLADGVGKGSARSIDDFHICRALEHCKEFLTEFGGHVNAAGFSIKTEDIPALREKINLYADDVLAEESLIPFVLIDEIVELSDINEGLVAEIELLAPFGHCNPGPVLAASGVRLVEWRPVGKKQNHLKLKVGYQQKAFNGIGFNLAHKGALLDPAKPVDLAFIPEINEWNGRRSIQLKLKDITRRAAIRSEGISCSYFPEEMVRSCQGILNNKQLRLSSPDYILNRLQLYREKGPVHKEVKEISTKFWRETKIHDYRDCPDRLGVLSDIIGPESVALLVTSGYQVVELAHSLALRSPDLAHRIIYYCRGMSDEAKEYVSQLSTPDSGAIIVTTPALVNALNIRGIGKVVLYYPPFNVKGLKTAVEVAGGSGELYLMFGTSDIAAASKSLTTLAPERDCLVALYRHLMRRVGTGKVAELPADKLLTLLMEDGGGLVENYTLSLAMRIFDELGLLKFGYRQGIYQVKMLPRPENKLNLEDSSTFRWSNDIALEGLQFISIIVSGNLKHITKLPYL